LKEKKKKKKEFYTECAESTEDTEKIRRKDLRSREIRSQKRSESKKL